MEIGRPSEKLQQVRKHAKHGAKYINDAMEIEEKGGKRLIPVVSKRNTPLYLIFWKRYLLNLCKFHLI